MQIRFIDIKLDVLLYIPASLYGVDCKQLSVPGYTLYGLQPCESLHRMASDTMAFSSSHPSPTPRINPPD